MISQTPLLKRGKPVSPQFIGGSGDLCVSPEKVSSCQEGRVQLRFSAYPYPDYGTLKGAVRAIAPDAITQSNSGVVAAYYEVMIQPEKLYFVKGDRSYPIQSGMEVTADIISRVDTVLTFVLREARLLTDL